MESDDANNDRRSDPPQQSIPLQELNTPSARRLRSLSDRGRDWLGHRSSQSGGSYSPIVQRDGSPQRPRAGPRLTIPESTAGPSSSRPEHSQHSPVDGAALQAAFSGLSFGPDPFGPASHTSFLSEHGSLRTLQDDAESSLEPDEAENYFPSALDTTPLTTNLQPIAGASLASTPTGQRHDRQNRRQSVRFRTPSSSPSGGRLGDDLAQAEAGRAGHGRRGSTSPRAGSLSPAAAGNPLQRAGAIVRNMSTRIVNITNDQDVVESTLRRKSSVGTTHPEAHSRSTSTVAGADGSDDNISPEKGPVIVHSPVEDLQVFNLPAPPMPNPLKGKSLGVFAPESKIRRKLADIFTNPITEPFILALITVQLVLLAIESSRNVYEHPRHVRWGTKIDIGLLVLFIIYTVEIICRSIISGFILNPAEYSTINRQVGLRQAVMLRLNNVFGSAQPSTHKTRTGLTDDSLGPDQPTIMRSFTSNMLGQRTGSVKDKSRVMLARRAYLRHSFNRLDFVAVVSYWISFVLAISGVQNHHQIFVFKMLSCLRILRLLWITNGTAVILRSLKRSAPLLANVAVLIGFFWLLFAIIGLQSFKSSFRRQCVWFDPNNSANNWTSNQYCGGWLDSNGTAQPWQLPSGVPPPGTTPKGFICPVNSKCIQGEGLINGTMSFDNIFQSVELVFVIMTSNTFSDLLYDLTMTDYLSAALFFAAGIVVLFFWLVSLLIAVITSSFQVIREEGRASAFTGEGQDEMAAMSIATQSRRRIPPLKLVYDKTYWVWIAIISFGLVVNCLRSAGMGPQRARFIEHTESIVTFILMFEIAFRFVSDWRHFFRDGRRYQWRNIIDLLLAIITGIMQLPPIHNSGAPYAWLTVFQILRIYRVVLAVSITRDLTLVVFKNITALSNQILFTFLLSFLAAILAAEMFRGTLPQVDSNGNQIRTTFQTIFNSFLGMYQILSSENWTDIMYHVTEYSVEFDTAWMAAAFFILWFILANFIVLNMFIAVIQENFDISEDEKRLKQVQSFLELKDGGSNTGNLSLSTVFKYGLFSGRRRDPLAFGTAATEMLLKGAVVRDFLDQQEGESLPIEEEDPQMAVRPAPTAVVGAGIFSSWWGSIVSRLRNREPNPFYSAIQFSRAYEELDPRTMAKEVMSAREKRKRAQRDYLQNHPNYNVSLFIFKPNNPIRRICQRIVGPGRGGDRIEGVNPNPPIWFAFSAFIYAAIVAMVVLACITTPLYQKEYFENHDFSVENWFVFSDMGFALVFTVEAAIKVIADGFFFTPNAYFRGSWGMIDGVVLLTLWINIATALANEGQVSRAVGAFKALRALRLLNVSDSARNNFHAVIVRGGWKVISAAFVSLSFLIPFAIYGLNLFLGQMYACNDNNSPFTDLNDCVDEYMSSPYNWNVWAPRQASNSYFSFDNFGESLFILFQIVSQEGWIDVMWRAQSITGVFTQQQPFASQGNAVFFVVFNLLGAVFVLTLFVSVFMRNYTEQTGVAFLTAEQRAWLELRKLLRQISPSKRPVSNKKRNSWKEWCYKRAIRKTGTWQRFVTGALLLHVVLLCLEWYPESTLWDQIRDLLFLLLTLIYIANITIRIIGLSWRRFRRSSWDFYSLFSVSGTFVTSILVLALPNIWVLGWIHELCLVSIMFLLIPRNNQLDQLFKTAVASLPLILNLLATWFVLFLTFAIAMTQAFGLTRFNANETGNVNFRNVPKALILLFRMSVGEGWNQIMEDFANVKPPYCVAAPTGKAFDTDCGSPEWARALFILWNIVSMYIFVNLFVSLIYESFSYVYQRSSGLSVISREEIRRFKQAWAEFDPDGNGYITKEQFPRLLGELSGVFEMRIYDGDFTVKRIKEDCSRVKRMSGLPIDGQEPQVEIDLAKLNERLAQLPRDEIRRRRARMNKFYEEVLVSADPDLGISFTSLLMILAHYKVINDNKSLRLHEFLRRRARLQRVEEAVRRNIVIGFFDTVYWARKFRAQKQSRNDGVMTTIPQFNVPAIFVDDEAANDTASDGNPFEPVQILTPGSETDMDFTPLPHDARQPLPPLRTRQLSRQGSDSSIQMTPTSPTGRGRAQGAHAHAPSDTSDNWHLAEAISRPVSPLGVEAAETAASRSRAGSSVSAQDVLEVLDNSAWGESIRRSFTMRRPGEDGAGGKG